MICSPATAGHGGDYERDDLPGSARVSVLVSASRRNDLNELATCKEKSAMARTPSPARETRALPNRMICLR
jgi:hypothetical protein